MGKKIFTSVAAPMLWLGACVLVIAPAFADPAATLSETPCNPGQKFRFRFSEPQQSCVWDHNGNLEPKQGYFQARREQLALDDNNQISRISVPPPEELCGMLVEFDQQEMWYDDEFFLVLDNVILYSSMTFTNGAFAADGILRLWAWVGSNGVRGVNWYDTTQPGGMIKTGGGAYCPGESTAESSCIAPSIGLTTGSFSLKLGPEVVKKLADRLPNNTPLDLRLISTGDDDPPTDCTHSAVDGWITFYVVDL